MWIIQHKSHCWLKVSGYLWPIVAQRSCSAQTHVHIHTHSQTHSLTPRLHPHRLPLPQTPANNPSQQSWSVVMCDWRPAVKHTRVCSFMCFCVRVSLKPPEHREPPDEWRCGPVVRSIWGGFCVWRTGAFCCAGNPIKTQPATGERMERAHTAPLAYKRKKGRSTFRLAPDALTLLQLWGLATTLPSMTELGLVSLDVPWTPVRSINSKECTATHEPS